MMVTKMSTFQSHLLKGATKLTPRIDPRIRSYFKETARSIISKDRQARKLGLSQNTIGEISRALAKAYTMGKCGVEFSDIAGTSSSSDVLDWAMIPPRARDTLISMTFVMSKRFELSVERVDQIERVSDGGRPRWRIARANGLDPNYTIANGAVSPLIRMGLLEPIDTIEQLFGLTELGLATCKEYWRRSDADDPTLPKMSLR